MTGASPSTGPLHGGAQPGPALPPPPAWVRAIDRSAIACALAASVLLAVAVLVVTYMVSNRASGASAYWEIEFAVFLMVGAVFLGSPYCLMTGGHVGVDLLDYVLPARARAGVALAIALAGLATCLYRAVAGFELACEAFVSNERTESMWAPAKWPLYASMPAGLGMTALQYCAELWRLSQRRREP